MFRKNQNYSTDKSVVITDFIPALLDKIKASLTDNIGCTFDASSTASISNSKICSCNCTVKVEKFDWFTLNKLALKTNSDSDIVVPPRANYLDVYGSEACEIEHNSNNNGVYQDFDLERYARSFDLIIAADVLYELEHAKIIPKVVKHLLVSKASPHANKAANDGLFVIVVPLRKTHKLEVEVFEQQMCAAGFELLKVFQCSLQQDLEEWADRIKESGNLDRVPFQKVLETEEKTQELYKCYFWANK
ncbi:hypothetical protein AX774_g1051 [Zancudomyces culisetae]|uniref:Uncharacterized protein n=1 Tax=Zancudomyces culisetae TaxID=1213189 RepID=A0A1R1PWN6_ZANCU|nr:hypothetical protein AX774_g1051 [Zancudomyces culisetae]|eukprot:OMH85400.1 hypothetical protein AX774_g1051 [Zancudomyces culisetae]